ncbi:efflux RND transporter periplasmic adaptor subunit [Arenibaculum sp.]|uniref:efflux RND transporter periplasmic adaptor subunit n=1 Tax=Arenibaculum sp. TaxID=2865862 RepID=UPI002E124402|nr:HlyD family efflux transporter periplasmic adaptor subunit [Arenibaculum sp.]
MTETSTKYLAMYIVENETQDFGASTITPEPESVGAPMRQAGTSEPVATGIVPILASSTFGRSVPTAGPEVLGSSGSTGASRPEPAAGSGPDWLPVEPGRKAGADGEPDRSQEADGPEMQAVLGMVRDTPHRRPDGSVFLPITTQRLFSMRWQVTRRDTVPVTHEIPGHVITNPASGTLVQATRPGIVEAREGRFPYLGMTVRRGDLLAFLRPVMSVSERVQIEARIQQLINQISLTNQQIVRLKEVLFVRYRENKIEALRVQLDGHRRELSALQAAMDGRDELRATADGMISQVAAVAGSAVDANQTVFGIVDPKELWVEAAAYDPGIAADIRDAAALTPDGQALELDFVGGGLTLSNQAIPLQFRVRSTGDGLSVGQPVTVIVRSQRTVTGVPVPAASIVRDGDGRTLVWERSAAEIFVPRQVQAERLAGDQMIVRSGLTAGTRVVVDGASILRQVR